MRNYVFDFVFVLFFFQVCVGEVCCWFVRLWSLSFQLVFQIVDDGWSCIVMLYCLGSLVDSIDIGLLCQCY